MRLFFLSLVMVVFSTLAFSQASFYSIPIDSAGGNKAIDLSAFKGKMILIVNTASQDSASGQYSELIQLQQLFKGGLIIIAAPTNSFNTEASDIAAMNNFYANGNDGIIQVAALVSVTGSSTHPLYDWLTHRTLNGVMDSKIFDAYQKYLINSKGKLVGVYRPGVSPMSTIFINAVKSALNN